MSKLSDLINELCPDGVEYISLSNKSLFRFKYGKGNSIPKDIGGIYNVYGANGIVSHINEYNCEDVTIIGHIGAVGSVNRSKGKCFVTYNGTIAEVVNKNRIDSQYFYYVLANLNLSSFKKGSQPFLSISDFSKIQIPIPPLPIQQEIVRILDGFTELTAELTKELELRKKQYEWYRSDLLNFKNQNTDVKVVTMGNIVTFLNGRAYKKEELLDNGKYKVIRVGNFFTNDKWYYSDLELDNDKYCENGDLIYCWSASLGPRIWNGEKSIFHYHIWKLRFDEKTVDKRYLYHYLLNDIKTINKSTTNSTMRHVSMENMKQRILQLPPLSEQQRIVSILDKFDAYCNDLTKGLPAEIELRQKQYEYYRNKLLTFKRKHEEV